jgi:hypothetical protein
MGLIGGIGRRVARRSRWLTERLWVVAALEAAWIANRHWRRLDRDERARLRELALRSRGRPSRLTESERAEAAELLRKIDYPELGGSVTGLFLPFRPLSRVVKFALDRTAPQDARHTTPGSS